MIVEFATQIGFMSERSLQQSGIMKGIVDPLLELCQALFPLGILLGDLLAVDVLNNFGYDRIQNSSIKALQPGLYSGLNGHL